MIAKATSDKLKAADQISTLSQHLNKLLADNEHRIHDMKTDFEKSVREILPKVEYTLQYENLTIDEMNELHFTKRIQYKLFISPRDIPALNNLVKVI